MGKKFFHIQQKRSVFPQVFKEKSKFSYGDLWYIQRKQGITNPRCRMKYALLQKKPSHKGEKYVNKDLEVLRKN